MKLASVQFEGHSRVVFALPNGKLGDLFDALCESGWLTDATRSLAVDMHALIRAGAGAAERLRGAYSFAVASPQKVKQFDVSEVTWHPPVRTPSKIVCLALNNRALDAIKIKAPIDHPAFFLKPSSALTGHMQAIRLRNAFGLTHPEPELAVIIGRELKDVQAKDAMTGVFGYSIMNDITSVGMREEDSFTLRYFKPDVSTGDVIPGEAHTSYPGRYKSSDTFAPMGPYIVTADEIPDTAALEISCRLGQRLVALDHTKNYAWSVADAIAHITRTMTLFPGDIISMGTGVGEKDPRHPEIPSITKVNLVGSEGPVSITIDRLGTLSNPIVTEAR